MRAGIGGSYSVSTVLNDAAARLNVGISIKLRVNRADATGRLIVGDVIASVTSSNSSVVTIDESGTIACVGNGLAKIEFAGQTDSVVHILGGPAPGPALSLSASAAWPTFGQNYSRNRQSSSSGLRNMPTITNGYVG